jgi:hypothetical protein
VHAPSVYTVVAIAQKNVAGDTKCRARVVDGEGGPLLRAGVIWHSRHTSEEVAPPTAGEREECTSVEEESGVRVAGKSGTGRVSVGGHTGQVSGTVAWPAAARHWDD